MFNFKFFRAAGSVLAYVELIHTIARLKVSGCTKVFAE